MQKHLTRPSIYQDSLIRLALHLPQNLNSFVGDPQNIRKSNLMSGQSKIKEATALFYNNKNMPEYIVKKMYTLKVLQKRNPEIKAVEWFQKKKS